MSFDDVTKPAGTKQYEKKHTIWISNKDFDNDCIIKFKLVSMDEPFSRTTHYLGEKNSQKCTRDTQGSCIYCSGSGTKTGDKHAPNTRFFWDWCVVEHDFQNRPDLRSGVVCAFGMNQTSNIRLKKQILKMIKKSIDPLTCVFRAKKMETGAMYDFEVVSEGSIQNSPMSAVETMNEEQALSTLEQHTLKAISGKRLPKTAVKSTLITDGNCTAVRADELVTVYYIDGKIQY